MAATAAAKRSICSSTSCGTYDCSGFPIRSVCGECLRQHMGGSLLPSFAERFERYATDTRRRCSSPSPSFSSSPTVTAEREEEEVDGPGRLAAFGDGRRPLRDCYMAPHLRCRWRPSKHEDHPLKV